MKIILLLYILLSCSCSLYGQNTIVAHDFYSLMNKVDKLHPPRHKKRKIYKLRDNQRKKYLSPENADTYYRSDTLYIMIFPDPSGVYVDGFDECLYNDSLFLRIEHYPYEIVPDTKWDAFLRKEMESIQQGKYELTTDVSNLWQYGYSLYYFIRLIRTSENEYSYQKDKYHIYHFNDKIKIYKQYE